MTVDFLRRLALIVISVTIILYDHRHSKLECVKLGVKLCVKLVYNFLFFFKNHK